MYGEDISVVQQCKFSCLPQEKNEISRFLKRDSVTGLTPI